MPKKHYRVGVDLAEGESKTVVVVIPKCGSTLSLEKDFELMQRRIAEALKVPIELIHPEDIKLCKLCKLCKHPAFNDRTTVTGRWSSKKPNT